MKTNKGICKLILAASILLTATVDATAQSKPHPTPATKAYTANVLPDVNYDLGDFAEGLAVVREGESKLCGVINDKGEIVVPFSIPLYTQYRGLPSFNKGAIIACLTENNRKGFIIINSRGEKVSGLPNINDISLNFVDGMATAFKKIPITNTRCRIVLRYYDTTGKEIYPALWQEVTGTYSTLKQPRPFKDGLSCYYDYKKKLYGYFNRQGKIVIPARFAAAHDFSEGKAAVSNDGKQWYYIDLTGKQCVNNIVLAMEPDDFHEGFAVAHAKNGYNTDRYMINEKGETVAGPLYYANRFFNGCAWVAVRGNGISEIIIDRNMKTIGRIPSLSPHKEFIYDETDNTIQVGPDIHKADGSKIFSGYNNGVKTFCNGLAPFKNSYGTGYLNKRGEIIILFKKR